MGADEPRLAALDARVGLGQVGAPGADRLDLGPGQHQARLERLLDGVVVAGTAIEGDGLLRHRSMINTDGERREEMEKPAGRPASPSLPREVAYRTASVVA